MGFSVSMDGKETVKSEPNVVPLCDVMLVLLIIFMIAMPILMKGITVKMPSAQFTTDMPDKPEVVLAITTDPRDPKGFVLYLNQDKVTMETLQNALEEAFLTASEKKLYLRADRDLEYGIFAEFLWDTIRAAGIESVGIITEKKTERID